MLFLDRQDAGRRVASKLGSLRGRSDVIVLGLPSGGVPVAFEVARALEVPLDVLLVRTLAVPGREGLVMGAVVSGGSGVLHSGLVDLLGISLEAIEEVAMREIEEILRKERIYRGERPSLDVVDRTLVLVDDGLASGSTMRAAVAALRGSGAAHVIVAVPVASAANWADLHDEADELICAHVREPFLAAGVWYGDFHPVTDEQVKRLLELASVERGTAAVEEAGVQM